jgi:hypothetical protein
MIGSLSCLALLVWWTINMVVTYPNGCLDTVGPPVSLPCGASSTGLLPILLWIITGLSLAMVMIITFVSKVMLGVYLFYHCVGQYHLNGFHLSRPYLALWALPVLWW